MNSLAALPRRRFVVGGCLASCWLLATSFVAQSESGLTPTDAATANMTRVRRLTLNEKADGYRGIWYSTRGRSKQIPYKYSGGMATYCAKHQPFAVYRPEVNKTFFCYGGAVAGNNIHLLHMVSYYDHETGEVPRPTILLDKQTSDARDNPVINIDAEGYIWIFSPTHGVARPSYLHRSKRPYDIDEFEPVTPTRQENGRSRVIDNFSYVQAFHQPKSGFSCFFTRYVAPVARTSYFMSSADGEKWDNYQPIGAIARGHYQVGAATEGKVATMMNYHPEETGIDGRTNVYYLESIDGGQSWQNAAGERVEVPMIEPQNPALVYDYEAEGRLVFVKDVKFDEQNNPVLLYLTSSSPSHGSEGNPRHWIVSRYREGKWLHSTITQSDHNYDYGSLDIRQNPWRFVGAVGPGPQPEYTGGEIVFWTSDDEGQTWRQEKQVTTASRVNQNYPRLAIDAHPDFFALWADGNPMRASPSQLFFCNAKGEVFRLPGRMEGDRAKPEPADQGADMTVAR